MKTNSDGIDFKQCNCSTRVKRECGNVHVPASCLSSNKLVSSKYLFKICQVRKNTAAAYISHEMNGNSPNNHTPKLAIRKQRCIAVIVAQLVLSPLLHIIQWEWRLNAPQLLKMSLQRTFEGDGENALQFCLQRYNLNERIWMFYILDLQNTHWPLNWAYVSLLTPCSC